MHQLAKHASCSIIATLLIGCADDGPACLEFRDYAACGEYLEFDEDSDAWFSNASVCDGDPWEVSCLGDALRVNNTELPRCEDGLPVCPEGHGRPACLEVPCDSVVYRNPAFDP